MDVYLKKRYDLILELVETNQGYTKHESETLEKGYQCAKSCCKCAVIDENQIREEFSVYAGAFVCYQ